MPHFMLRSSIIFMAYQKKIDKQKKYFYQLFSKLLLKILSPGAITRLYPSKCVPVYNYYINKIDYEDDITLPFPIQAIFYFSRIGMKHFK